MKFFFQVNVGTYPSVIQENIRYLLFAVSINPLFSGPLHCYLKIYLGSLVCNANADEKKSFAMGNEHKYIHI